MDSDECTIGPVQKGEHFRDKEPFFVCSNREFYRLMWSLVILKITYKLVIL